MTQALVLFSHGARDPGWARPVEDMARALRERRPGFEVRLAFLEMMSPDLPTTLAELAQAGVHDVAVAPVFWARGGHIVRDLADEVGRFCAAHPGVRVRILPVLSELPGMQEFLAGAIALAAQGP